jgi:hypothetical protein
MDVKADQETLNWPKRRNPRSFGGELQSTRLCAARNVWINLSCPERDGYRKTRETEGTDRAGK